MRIGIDARFYGLAGPGRYVKNLIKYLERIDNGNEYIIFLNRGNFNEYSPANPHFKKILADYPWYGLREQLFLPLKIWHAGVDLMHFPQFNIPVFWPGCFVVTIHDMIMHEFSTERETTRHRIIYRLKRIFYLLTFSLACRRSIKIIVPSLATKNDLVQKLNISGEKITVTYEGVDELFTFPPVGERAFAEKILNKYGIRKPFLLYVGSMYPHKNLDRLVQAFKILQTKFHYPGQLVLAGKESFFSMKLRKRVRELFLKESILFPAEKTPNGYLPDAEIKTLFAEAEVYVFPSLKEGFGLPPLEAMSFGLPVAAANTSCLQEIYGPAASYFNPLDIFEMAHKIDELIRNPDLKKELIEKGYQQAKKYSWEEMARQTLNVYQSLKK